MIENVPIIAAVVALAGLSVALMLYRKNDAIEIDNEKVAEITEAVSYTHLTLPTNREV